MQRRVLLSHMVSWACLGLASQAAAQVSAAPDKPIKLLIPYAAGGNVDATARTVMPELSRILQAPVLVENKPGAGGMIAGEFVAKAAPDGVTLFVSSNGPILHSPIIYGKPVYNWRKDFIPVGPLTFTPMVLLASPHLKSRGLEIFDLAMQRPGTVSMATPGAGSTNHLAAEMLQMRQGVRWNIVHYKGTAPALTDLLGGHVDLSFDQVSVAAPHVRQGRLRAVAVTASKRLPQLPDVPTFEELGIKGFDISTFVGVFAPAATPANTIERLSDAIRSAVKNKTVADAFGDMGAQVRAMTPKEFRDYLLAEDERWLPVIDKAGIRLNP